MKDLNPLSRWCYNVRWFEPTEQQKGKKKYEDVILEDIKTVSQTNPLSYAHSQRRAAPQTIFFPLGSKSYSTHLGIGNWGQSKPGYDHKPMEQIKSLTYSLTKKDMIVLPFARERSISKPATQQCMQACIKHPSAAELTDVWARRNLTIRLKENLKTPKLVPRFHRRMV